MPKTAKSARRARVVLDLSGASPEIEDSDNVEAVTDVDSRNLVVHFGIPFRDELYRCDVIASEPVGYEIKTRSKDGVGIQLSPPWPSKIKIVCEEI